MNISFENCICSDEDGNVFLSLEDMTEEELSRDSLLTHCLAVVKLGDEHLLGWNRWRNRYEVFGGCVERGETARECIVRECREELGIETEEIIYLGAMRFLMKPDHFSSDERIELGGLYGVSLPPVGVNELYRAVYDKEEIVKLGLYGTVKGRESIAVIDEKLLGYFP